MPEPEGVMLAIEDPLVLAAPDEAAALPEAAAEAATEGIAESVTPAALQRSMET
jgi:hypothetical protein